MGVLDWQQELILCTCTFADCLVKHKVWIICPMFGQGEIISRQWNRTELCIV